MANGSTSELAVLQHIAAFSAAVRGHELGAWEAGDHSAVACCVRCGAAVRVYFPAVQPEMDGPALEQLCGENAAKGWAA
jgi:hypothetical protein